MICIALTGCMGYGALSHKQVKMLKKQGFELTDEGWSLGLPERILFSFDNFEISDQNQILINQLAEQLKKYELDKVRIVGHSDNVGNPEYNLQLSEKRAQSVAEIFVENKFKTENVQVVGKGSLQPINNIDSDESRAENRRVSIIIIP